MYCSGYTDEEKAGMKDTSFIHRVIFSAFVIAIIIFAASKNTPLPEPVQSVPSYMIRSNASATTYTPEVPEEYTFSIIDEEGALLKDFSITHTKRMHVIIVRKDLKYFQHVHPEFNRVTGLFTLSGVVFPAAGPYRIFADFAPASPFMDSIDTPMVTLSEDLFVGAFDEYTPAAIGTTEKTKVFDGYTVNLNTHGMTNDGAENMLMFTLSQKGKRITDLEPYLGALGHSVILREGSLDFIHAHPLENARSEQTGTVDFMVTFPESGIYKVFTQFQRNQKILTTDFVVSVDTERSGEAAGAHVWH